MSIKNRIIGKILSVIGQSLVMGTCCTHVMSYLLVALEPEKTLANLLSKCVTYSI